MIAPWMLKNWIVVQNPIAPFGNAIFRNPYFHPILRKAIWRTRCESYGVTDKRALPLEVTIRGEKTQGLLGITFLLAPLALLALRYRHGPEAAGRGCAAGAAVFRQHRHALPDSAAAVCFAGDGDGLGQLTGAAGRADDLPRVHFLAVGDPSLRRQETRGGWARFRVTQALRLVPQEQYLRERSRDIQCGSAGGSHGAQGRTHSGHARECRWLIATAISWSAIRAR